MDNLWIIYGSGWWFQPTPLKYEFVSWDYCTIPNTWEKTKCSKPPTMVESLHILNITIKYLLEMISYDILWYHDIPKIWVRFNKDIYQTLFLRDFPAWCCIYELILGVLEVRKNVNFNEMWTMKQSCAANSAFWGLYACISLWTSMNIPIVVETTRGP